ncbi:MAG: carboxypeptidase regulatory-like domain-containing protein [Pirellulaceae bacterium]|jgi:hypothetical protein|nr:carboxypeptidase regulatory-like domain-containing protein [Pirellulaceae bacterium]
MKSVIHLAWALAFICLATGCGNGLSGVSGTVTLDGEPLEKAFVEFSPPNGRPSMGKTDSNGYYRLEYSTSQTGVEAGEHKVRIFTHEDASIDMKTGEPTPAVKEIVPAKYHRKSELTAQVEPGSNDIDFDLES